MDRLTRRSREEHNKQVRDRVVLQCSASQVRSRSLIDLRCGSDPGIIQSTRIMSVSDTETDVNSKTGKPRTCHNCHCPISDPYHAGVSPGVNHCTLEHWQGCQGGRMESVDGILWTACPPE